MSQTLAYSKLNLEFDRDLFIREYDERILPNGIPINNDLASIKQTEKLNRVWGMVDPALYNTGDTYIQPGDHTTMKRIKRSVPAWTMTQLMQLDTETVSDPLLKLTGPIGGTSLRNETLAAEYKFTIKPHFSDLAIVEWIGKNLLLTDIRSIHCVSLEEGSFATIHRDAKGLYNEKSSAGINRVFGQGYVTVCINVSSGGVPLYWSLDGADAVHSRKADDMVYLANDYFLHGVPVCASRRRQVRVTGIPVNGFYDSLDQTTTVDVGQGYNFDPTYPNI